MKILRVRRGFTTNSSASSEWVPPAWQGLYSSSSPSGSSGSATGSSGTPPAAPAGGPATGTAVSPVNPPTPSTGTNLTGNSMTIGLVIAGVLLIFAAERVVRRLLRRKNAEVTIDD